MLHVSVVSSSVLHCDDDSIRSDAQYQINMVIMVIMFRLWYWFWLAGIHANIGGQKRTFRWKRMPHYCLAKVLWTGQTKNCILSVAGWLSCPTSHISRYALMSMVVCLLFPNKCQSSPITNPGDSVNLLLAYLFATQAVRWGPFIIQKRNFPPWNLEKIESYP